jgi:hypothetical protein
MILFLGAPRTATHSLFDLLRKHPNITYSVIKEPFNDSPYKDIFPYRYFSEFKLINQDTKYLLDGTPCAYSFFTDKVIDIPGKKKIIYPMRNPFDRVYSTIKQTIMTRKYNDKKVQYPSYLSENLDINVDKLIKYIPFMMDSLHLEKAFTVTDDVFIFRFDKMNMKDIFGFLELDPIDGELETLNRMRIWEKDDHKKIVDKIWRENFKTIANIILNNLMEVKKYVDVEDWIEEANNILSDV